MSEGDDIGVDDGGHSHQSPSTNSRQSPHHIQQEHIPRERAPQTADQKGDGAGEETRASSEDVGEAAVQRLKGGAGDQIGGGQPGRGVGGVELGADERVRRGGDSAVEPGEKDVGKDGCNLALR